MTQHTPGPWHVGVKQAEKIVYDSTGWAVANATVYHGENDAEQVKANARLIAAAPDLLEFAKAVVRYAGSAGDDYLADKARDVIAQATGDKT